ncbi:MAG: NAD(P)-dependent oxidoreductase [Clostridia bacterium]|nr:NAD(P)-dependent oxidoreductase [Clostridia bacterium]
MSKTIALTGTTGAMGGEVLLSLLQSDKQFNIRAILFDKEKKIPSFVKNTLKKYRDRVYAFKGDISRYDDCAHLIDGADYVINCASLIPPKSDHNPTGTYQSNFVGTKNIVDAIAASGRADDIGLVHIATVAMYGHRAYPHLWIRVGDPIISSDYDVYSMHKLKAEKYVLESGLKKFVSLRQTAVLHKYMFKNNLKDGLMFHTTYNGALEWVTDADSGILCRKLVEKDTDGQLDNFWNRIYNIGGGAECRITGFETFEEAFGIMGGGAKKFFKPNYNITRNFHGGWFMDSDDLEEKLEFRNETNADFWARMNKKYAYYKAGKLLPAPLVAAMVIKPLLKNTNAPKFWVNKGKSGRVKAFFGGETEYRKIPDKWDDYPLLCENKLPDGSEVDYKALKDIANAKNYALDHGYDDSKPLNEITLEDLKSAAKFRGGKCLAKEYGGELHNKLLWKCRDGHEFTLTPFTVLKGGYWCPHCCEPKPWKYGAIADIPFYGQVYFDSHDDTEVDDVFPVFDHEEDFIIKK